MGRPSDGDLLQSPFQIPQAGTKKCTHRLHFISPGGCEEKEEIFLLGLKSKKLMKTKCVRYKFFARKDVCGLEMPQTFYQEMSLKS